MQCQCESLIRRKRSLQPFSALLILLLIMFLFIPLFFIVHEQHSCLRIYVKNVIGMCHSWFVSVSEDSLEICSSYKPLETVESADSEHIYQVHFSYVCSFL